ncbi:MAG: hypothetical protein HY553_03365 [Elusimicrobia bacterium]|nr:hypothetical protein [Elusimicrobiota bacterium]
MSDLLGVREVEGDVRLQLLLAGLNLYAYISFAGMIDNPAYSTLGTHTFNFVPMWPVEGLRRLVVLDQFWTNAWLALLSLASVLGFFLAALPAAAKAAGRPSPGEASLRWSMLILAFAFANTAFYYLQEFRLMQPFKHAQLFVTFSFLVSRSKLFFVRLTLLCCYLDAAYTKMTPSWLAGEAFNSTPDKLPLLPKSDGFVLAAGWALMALELVGPWLWFSSRAGLRKLSVRLLVLFHLYSTTLVGWTYPAIMLLALVPAFLDFDRPIHAGYRWNRRHVPSWLFIAALFFGGLWPAFIPGPILLTGEGRWLRMFMFEANRSALFTAEIVKGGRRMELEVERPARSVSMFDYEGQATTQAIVRGRCEVDGRPVPGFDPTRTVFDESGTAIWNPQVFTSGESAVFGDPYLYWAYGKELCRRYRPDRLRMRLLSRLNRTGPRYRVLDIDDFCVLDPAYDPLGHNPWIRYEALP